MDKQYVERITAEVLGQLDLDWFAEARDEHSGNPRQRGYSKYLDVEKWIEVNARRAVALGLVGCAPLRILDIGTGCGYFPLVCKHLGHEPVALDCAGRGQLFRDVAGRLGIDVVTYDVHPLVPLPKLGAFDAIAAFMVTFNGHRTEALWGVREWRYFLNDCDAAIQPDGGTIVIELNREPHATSCYTPELERFFADRGAQFTGSWPHHPEPGGHRLVLKR